MKNKENYKFIKTIIIFLLTYLLLVVASFEIISYFNNRYYQIYTCDCQTNKDLLIFVNEVNLHNDYCPYCGKPLSETICIRQKKHCINCGNAFDVNETYCKKCGGTYVDDEYVNVSKTEFKSLNNLKIFSVIYIIAFIFKISIFPVLIFIYLGIALYKYQNVKINVAK